ncbi:AraC-like DNA-binding protein [Algoriphagus aquaeductus]|uniref:AraC-like DNA-binding protein n=1 Tax=Algoriphagus aquaeductus TaxID=475299 RepID=A0A326RZ85_9BACT|nr:AraC family transcriptional regulator [Algoriphagus aquaeductus]PZV87191.1 AraC-like DNA-binding protein [Algoriphagus aquaeductus]
MIIRKFNPDKGLYFFETRYLQADFHAHPAAELLVSEEKPFCILGESGMSYETYFAVIPRNVIHGVQASDDCFKLMLVENQEEFVFSFLNARGNLTGNEDGFFLFYPDRPICLADLYDLLTGLSGKGNLDQRVVRVMDLFHSCSMEYPEFISEVKRVSHLSDGRIAHLFKREIGVSLKKYLLWVKLKKAISLLLEEKEGILNALLESGFYDQAHFSNSFRRFLGVKPSFGYNSRIVQVFTGSK